MDDGLPLPTTPPGEDGGSPRYLVTGLAVGIPCGIIIVLLIFLIGVMVCVTMCSSRESEEVEAMYMRRRFQGLSLEEQRRRRQKAAKGRFISRRRSSATGSKPSPVQLLPNTRARVMKANPFGLQDWQLKLSGIDVNVDGGETATEETDMDSDSPRSPIGAFNPLLLQDPIVVEDEVQPSYEPVQGQQQDTNAQSESHPPYQTAAISDEDSSDSFNPYD